MAQKQVTIGRRELTRNVAGTLDKATEAGPIVVTNRNEPCNVIVSIEDWHRLQEEPEREK